MAELSLGNLQTQINGKAASSHTHTKANITDFSHTHTVADITGTITATNADTVDNKHASDFVQFTGSGGVARIANSNGYLEIGAMNTSYCHYYTDRPVHYFDKPIYIAGKVVATTDQIPTSFLYAENSSKLYSTDSTYKYGGTAPYYGYLTYNSPVGRWRFQVSPATPSSVEVAYADTAGSIPTSDIGGNIWIA